MVKVTFQTHDGTEFVIDTQPGKTLMEVARKNNLTGILAECGGSCACATCHVYVADGWYEKLPDKDDMESDMLDFAWEPKEASRLSCQITLSEKLDGLTVRIPEEQA